MRTCTLTADQERLLVTALNTAAEQFDRDAQECESAPRLAEQFEAQAEQARRLASALEDAESGTFSYQWEPDDEEFDPGLCRDPDREDFHADG